MNFETLATAILLSSYAGPGAAQDADEVSSEALVEVSSDSEAVELKTPALKVEGRVHFNVDVNRLSDGESSHEANIDISTKRKKGAKVETELEFTSESDFYLKEIFIDQERSWGKLRIGKQEKNLGIETIESKKNRIAIHRSKTYDKIREFNYTADEMMVRALFKDEKETHEGTIAIGFNQADDAFLNATYQNHFGNHSISTTALLQLNRTDETRQVVWVGQLGHGLSLGAFGSEAEFFYGVDPFETEVEEVLGTGQKVYFSSVKVLGYYDRRSESKAEGLKFFGGFSNIVHDVRVPAYTTEEYLLGFHLFDGPIVYSAQLQALGTNSKVNESKRLWEQSGFSLELSFYF